jgi:hypothetical protein
MTTTYRASCHCGRVQLEVTADDDGSHFAGYRGR